MERGAGAERGVLRAGPSSAETGLSRAGADCIFARDASATSVTSGLQMRGEPCPSGLSLPRAVPSRPWRARACICTALFGFGDPGESDPFLLLDDFRNDDPAAYRAGFPWHPHRRASRRSPMCSTARSSIRIRSATAGCCGPGSVQWMTAGSGILHQEMPRGSREGRMHGFQLWANLPSSLKMTAPRYQDIEGGDIPEIVDDDGTGVKIIIGSFWGKRGPVDGIAAEPMYLDVAVPAGVKKTLPVDTRASAFAYVFGGLGELSRRRGAGGGAGREGVPRPGAEHPRPVGQPDAGALRVGRRGDGAGGAGGGAVPAGRRAAAEGAGGLARADRDEHPRGTGAGDARAAERDVHHGSRRRARPRRRGRGCGLLPPTRSAQVRAEVA